MVVGRVRIGAADQRVGARTVVVRGRRVVVVCLGVVAATILAHASDVGGVSGVVVGAGHGAAEDEILAKPRRLDGAARALRPGVIVVGSARVVAKEDGHGRVRHTRQQ